MKNLSDAFFQQRQCVRHELERGEEMVFRILGVTIGVVVVVLLAAAAPDLKRYMRMRSM